MSTKRLTGIMAAVSAALVGGAIFGSAAIASATTDLAPPRSPAVVDTPEPGDTLDVAGAVDTSEFG
jgi:hypothetical protein